jgi:peptide/nickel transport system permease protein
MTLGSFAGLQRYVRSSMLEVLELDYVRSARAKGCKERDVINKHALRNSMIPTVTLIGLSFGFMITGSMLTEQVFALNGMGKFYLKVIKDRDYFVIQAIVLLITGTVILANLITDLLYGILDPRIRL